MKYFLTTMVIALLVAGVSQQVHSAPPVVATDRTDRSYPVRVTVPAIGLDAPIETVGIDSQGRMDVPSGTTDNVGWYRYGTLPGETGSAVLAAHVYAAFKNLHSLSLGNDIYLQMENGEILHFVVEEVKRTALSDVSPYFLFERSDLSRLNLITCAGSYIPALGTYDERLIVYAILVP